MGGRGGGLHARLFSTRAFLFAIIVVGEGEDLTHLDIHAAILERLGPVHVSKGRADEDHHKYDQQNVYAGFCRFDDKRHYRPHAGDKFERAQRS